LSANSVGDGVRGPAVLQPSDPPLESTVSRLRSCGGRFIVAIDRLPLICGVGIEEFIDAVGSTLPLLWEHVAVAVEREGGAGVALHFPRWS
jgi:hypothetical protein